MTVGQLLGQVSGLRESVDSTAVVASRDTDEEVLEAPPSCVALNCLPR
jgi:hypothetical protein